MIVEINLLPRRGVFKKTQIKNAALIYSICAVSMIAVMVVIHQFYSQKNTTIAFHIQELHSQLIAKTQPINDPVLNIDGVMSHKVQRQVNKLKAINDFFHINSSGTYIKKIVYKTDCIIFVGTVDSIQHLRDLMSAMLKIHNVQSIRLDSLKRDQLLLRFQLRVMDEA